MDSSDNMILFYLYADKITNPSGPIAQQNGNHRLEPLKNDDEPGEDNSDPTSDQSTTDQPNQPLR